MELKLVSSPYVLLAHYGELEWVRNIRNPTRFTAKVDSVPNLESKSI